jgi:hypothetical protein
MDNFIHRVQTPKVPQYVGRTTSVSDLAKVIRDGEKPHSNVSAEVQAKSPTVPTVEAEHRPIAPLEQVLPLAILQSPKLVQAEWAWRRLLTEADQQAAVHDGNSPNASSAENVLLPRAIRVLWDAMSQVAERTAQVETVRIPGSLLHDAPVQATSSDGGTLLSFHALKREHVEKIGSDPVRSMVLEDRWANVTRTSDAPLCGSGLWVPAPLPPGQGSTAGVRWEVERYTRPGKQGQSVHRLRLVVPYDGQPVAVQFVCAYPSVSVHVSTDDEALQQRLRESSSRVAEALSTLGWRLDQWSVGAWEGESS